MLGAVPAMELQHGTAVHALLRRDVDERVCTCVAMQKTAGVPTAAS